MEEQAIPLPSTLNPDVHKLHVQIMEFIEEGQPGVVRAEFMDSEGRRHTLIDKVPIFSSKPLDASCAYPTPGVTRCSVLARSRNSDGREIVRISTTIPDFVESSEGLSEFVVLATQLFM